MKIVFKKTVADILREKIYEAISKNKEIDYVLMSHQEFATIKREMEPWELFEWTDTKQSGYVEFKIPNGDGVTFPRQFVFCGVDIIPVPDWMI